ncbi:hypothetical protein HYU12_04440 [Candidatus Woesearchaeota archaeon]|nr:hypothetical protein [Candidatus Woesearchaeota archaeon]
MKNNRLSGLEFRRKTLNSFVSLRGDVDGFKASMNDWILFLNREVRVVKDENRSLQKRISELEIERRVRL